jgi:hypothetical protein
MDWQTKFQLELKNIWSGPTQSWLPSLSGESETVLTKYGEKNSTYKWEPPARFEHVDDYKITTNYL